MLSPRLLTIHVPVNQHKEQSPPTRPPQEIVVGRSKNHQSPLKTIEVSKHGHRPPPSVVVVVKKELDITYQQDTPQNKPDNNSLLETASAKENSVRRPAEQSVDTRRQGSFCGIGNGRSRTILIETVNDDTSTQRKSEIAPFVLRTRRRPKPIVTATVTTTAQHNPDPPAAKAPTTSKKILPDFSGMARRHTQLSSIYGNTDHSDPLDYATPSSRNRRQDKLIISHQKLHQSWSGTTAVQQARACRAGPAWMRVTGAPEDWIRATGPSEIQQVGAKLAKQRLFEA